LTEQQPSHAQSKGGPRSCSQVCVSMKLRQVVPLQPLMQSGCSGGGGDNGGEDGGGGEGGGADGGAEGGRGGSGGGGDIGGSGGDGGAGGEGMETSQHRPGSSAWPHGHCKNISSWHVKPSARRSWHVLPLQLRLHFWGRGADGGVLGGEGGVSGGDDGGGDDGGGGDGALRTERVTLRLSTRTMVTPRSVDSIESGRRARTASAVVASAAVRKSIDALTRMPEAGRDGNGGDGGGDGGGGSVGGGAGGGGETPTLTVYCEALFSKTWVICPSRVSTSEWPCFRGRMVPPPVPSGGATV